MTDTPDPAPQAGGASDDKSEAVAILPRKPGILEEWRDGWLTIVILLAIASFLGAAASFAWRDATAPAPQAAAPAEPDARVLPLQQRVAEMGDELAQRGDAFAALESRVKALEGRDPAAPAIAADPDAAARLKAATDALLVMEDRVAALEQRFAAADSAPADLAAMTDLATRVMNELQAVKDQLAALEAKLPPAELPAQIGALDTRVQALERTDAAALARRASSSLALTLLARAASGAQPFAAELETLRRIVPDPKALEPLKAHAETGVPDLQALKARFAALVPAVLHAEAAGDDQYWFERLWTNFTSLVTIRATGEVSGETAEAILARAELRLAEGRLDAAAGEMDALQGAARDAARGWIDDAKARLALDAAVAALTAQLIAEAPPGTP